jgi:hypothetical protein
MKKYSFLIIFFLISFFLVSCDYPEKSFQALNRQEIPNEVTMDFELPIGIYAPFVWSSSHEDVLKINNQNQVTVTQQIEDVLVTITARINKRNEDFLITVLKIGSELTMLEKARIVLNDLDLSKEVLLPFELPTIIDGIHLRYLANEYFSNYYDIQVKKDDSTWFLPFILETEKKSYITVEAYVYHEGTNNYNVLTKKTYEIKHIINPNVIHPFVEVYNALEVEFAEGDHQEHVTKNFVLPLTSNINENAIITWETTDLNLLILSDQKTVQIMQFEGIRGSELKVSITIDELTYTFSYPILLGIFEQQNEN